MQSYKTSKSTKRLQHFSRNGLAFDQLTKTEQKDLETTEYSKIERKTIIQFHVAMVAGYGYARLASCTDTAIKRGIVCGIAVFRVCCLWYWCLGPLILYPQKSRRKVVRF